MRWPVPVCLAAICTMGWQALVRWLARGDRGGTLAAVGALLFIAPDTVLAVNRFGRPFAAASLLVLTTCFAPQWCIAGSIAETPDAPWMIPL